MYDPMLPLPGLSPVAGKKVVVNFDGGLLSSDGRLLALREVEQRLRVADRIAACIEDPRAPDQITHTLADIIRFRLLMIAAGYEDGNDASSLRSDPMFKMALDLSPSAAKPKTTSSPGRRIWPPTARPARRRLLIPRARWSGRAGEVLRPTGSNLDQGLGDVRH